jgi:ribonucleoside-diphosphate reductase alpha chain
MLRVMGMHRDAAHAINRDACPPALYRAACEDWDAAVRLGALHGYRNAQATVLAPTGTIGLLMDCDTTGIEPDFALVKFKKLAGGGYFKIVNQSVPAALRKLGYSPAEVQEIVAYVSGTNTLLAAPEINRRTLKNPPSGGPGLADADLSKVEAALPSVFDLDPAFGSWVLGEETYERLGVTKEMRKERSFSLLVHLGFTREQITKAGEVIIGRMTVEGAPHLQSEDYPVFDCANRCGPSGQRYLAPMSHVKMMAAAQPFLSGAISKTVNLPNDATVDEVAGIYEEGWRLGLKAVALYRDGCKASQPLSTSSKDSKDDAKDAKNAREKAALVASSTMPPASEQARPSERPSEIGALTPLPLSTEPQDATQLTLQLTRGERPHGLRVRLPKKRSGFTQEARVGGHKIFLRTGEYQDGTLGEIFIDMHKEGAAFRSLMNCFAMSVSIGLQYGVPLNTYVEQFTFTRFEPQGVVEGHPNVKFSTSIVDYLFRVLGVEYLHRYDLAHVKPESVPERIPEVTGEHAAITSVADAPLSHTMGAVVQSAIMSEGLEGKRSTGYEAPGAADARREGGASPLDQQLDQMMGDAPVCDVCGHITVRNGACYKCLNCGNSMGCS